MADYDDTDDVPLAVPTEAARIETSAESYDGPSIPVTIVTGFLGSGKTTLITRLLKDETHGKRVAVILNEFGESSGIDKSLTVTESGDLAEEWVELSNGCLCCSVKDAGVAAIEGLIQRKRGKFDYVVMETTGLADPGPIASMFWLDKDLPSCIYLDGIVTVVDAKYASQQIAEDKADGSLNEAVRQIALADRIIINKTDLSSPEHVDTLEETIRSINSVAPVLRTTRSSVPMDFFLDLHCFDDKMEDPFSAATSSHSDHDHDRDQDHRPSKHIDQTVETITFLVDGEIDSTALDRWLMSLLWDRTLVGGVSEENQLEVLRLKALLNVKGSGHKLVAQGVRELYDVQEAAPWLAGEVRQTKMVVIGRNLRNCPIEQSFRSCCLV